MKAVIFDMDGVLVDTEEMYVYLTSKFMLEHHQKVNIKDIQNLAGGDYNIFFTSLGKLWNPKMDTKEMYAYFKKYNKNDENLDVKDIVFPHTRFVLNHLKEDGYKLALASSSRISKIDQILDANDLRKYFEVIVSGEHVEKGKPDPMIYFKTMEELNVDAKDCVIIEDSNYGLEAAVSSGAYVIAREDTRFNFKSEIANYVACDLLDAYLHIISL